MFLRTISGLFALLFCFSSTMVFADEVIECSSLQIQRCSNFCSQHEGMQSCQIDLNKRSGTCTCKDGKSITK